MPSFNRNDRSYASSQDLYGATDYSYERDNYYVYLHEGQSATVTNWTLGSSDTYIFGVYDPTGSYIDGTSNDDSVIDGRSTASARTHFTASTSGNYRISAGSYSFNTGSYRLNLQISARISQSAYDNLIDSYDTNYTSSSPYSLGISSSPTVVNGYIEAGEQSGYNDNYSFNVVAGSSYTVRMQGSPSGYGTLRDTFIRGVWLNGSYMGSNDDSNGSLDSAFTFYASTSGTVRVSAGAYGSNTGSYRLSLSRDSVAPAYQNLASSLNSFSSYSSFSTTTITTIVNTFSSYTSFSSNLALAPIFSRTLSMMNFSSFSSYSQFSQISSTSAFTQNFSSVIQNSSFSSFTSTQYSAINWQSINYSNLSSTDFSSRLNFSRFSRSDFSEMFRSTTADEIEWGSVLSNRTFASSSVQSNYSSISWSSVFSSSSFSNATSSAYSNVHWGQAFAQTSFRSMSARAYTNINWGNVQWNELTSSTSYANVNWGRVEYNEFTSSSYSQVNWGRVEYNEFTSSSYSQVNWGRVEYNEMNSSSFSGINWARVDRSEMGRCDLTALTDDNRAYGSVNVRHISSRTSSYSASSRSDIVTAGANLGRINIAGELSRSVGDIYGINTGTMLNITNFDRGVDFLNLGRLNASLLTTQIVGSNTVVNYNGNAVATLIGLSGATVAQLFG